MCGVDTGRQPEVAECRKGLREKQLPTSCSQLRFARTDDGGRVATENGDYADPEMATCVFCGNTNFKSGRSKEHILPMWLLRATGDPHRNIRIEFDPDSGADIIRPASTFHFPACSTCNESYGKKLEVQAQRAMTALFRGRSLRVSECYRLLDWLDKVRIGLWLGYHMLHKEIFEPKFRIDAPLGKKDRIAIISVDPKDTFRGLSIGGCDNNVFRTSQAGIYLRINNVRMLSLSSDFLVSSLAGAPYMEEMFLMAGNSGNLAGYLKAGSCELSQDWEPFSRLGATIIAQPIFFPGFARPDQALEMYFNTYMLARLKNVLRIFKLEHLARFYPMQLISNADSSFRYYTNRNERIRFGKAEPNDDAYFMRSLYSILAQRVLPLNPKGVITANGKKNQPPVLLLLWTEKLLQIVFRLEKLGISDPNLKAEVIDEVHRLSRLREEVQSHIHGTCTPDSAEVLKG
jgi:hypothetical protein